MRDIIKNFNKNNLILILFYFFTSLVLTSLFIGLDNLSINNTKWLFSGDDRSAHQIGWYFFRNDIWRFPLGVNPNFGDQIGNSIVYSDSIPIFALIFKAINFLLPEKFQYFSLWFVLCFFLQGILSYFLILKFTDNKIISICLSFIFLLFPPALHRIGWHPALFAHWTLILSFFLILKEDVKENSNWILLILLTSLIHFYFTVINLIIYNLIKFFNLIYKRIKLKNYLFSIFTCHISLIILMYLVGYFEVRVVDTFALGFGFYKLNLLSIFDSTVTYKGLSWSWLLPDIVLSNGEELEGFNFIGLGGLLLATLGTYIFLSDKNLRAEMSKKINNGVYFSLIIIFILSLSNNVSIGKLEVLQIPLHDYFYGPLSIIRSSGRLFWILSYFILFFSIFLVSRKFKKKSLIIFYVLLVIQLLDTSSGMKNFSDNNDYQASKINSVFWKEKSVTQLENILTTNPVNYNKYFDKLAFFIETNNIKKTNIIKLARVDRNKAAKNRYQLVEDFSKKNLKDDTIYIIDNVGHLLNLKEIFQNENVGFFFKDNIWIMIKDKKNLMNETDRKIFKDLIYYEPKFNKEEKPRFKDYNNYIGLGWTHNFNKEGIWSEGKISNLIFKINDKQNDIFFEMDVLPFVNKKNNELNINVFVNGKYNNSLKFKFEENLKSKKNRKVVFKIKKENITNNTINIEFKNENPISPLDLFLSPDSRQLGFLLLKFNLLKKYI